MAEPVVADTKPALVTLEPGVHFWCRCGRSQNQPFCDGSHVGTEFTPMKIEVEEEQRMALCLCKHTQNEPLCDGSHKKYR